MKETFKTTSLLESDLDGKFTPVGTLFNDLETQYGKLSNMLDSDRWKGVSAGQCKDIQALLTAYEQAIRPLVASFKGNCAQLLESIDSFCSESFAVSELKKG